MTLRKLSIGFFTVLMSLSISATVNAEYIFGELVTADYRYPDASTSYPPAGGPLVAPVGPGVEFGFFGVNNPTVDVSATNILIEYSGGFSLDGSPNAFDGIVVSSTSANISDIIGVTLDSTNIPGMVDLSFDDRNVFINQDFLANSFAPGSFISVDVQFAAVPEPASIALWSLLSAAGFGYIRSRKRKPENAIA